MSDGWEPLNTDIGEGFMYGIAWAKQGHVYANVDTGLFHGPSEYDGYQAILRHVKDQFVRNLTIGILTDIKESVAGVEAKGYITDDRVLGYLKGAPTEFSIREPYIVEPYEDVEAKRLVDRWGSDCEVPTYVIEEFKDFLAEHLEIPRAYLESEV